MLSSRSRIALGCLLAAAVGTFGPISRAVSMESRRLVEVYVGESLGGDGNTAIVVGHGASAEVRTGDGPWTIITLRVEERRVGRLSSTDRSTSATVESRDRAIMTVRVCEEYQCSSRTLQGLGDLRLAAGSRTFRGTLTDDAGSPCEIEARWAHSDPVYEQDGIYRPLGARGAATTTCAGTFGWGPAEGRIYAIAGEYR